MTGLLHEAWPQNEAGLRAEIYENLFSNKCCVFLMNRNNDLKRLLQLSISIVS